MTTTTTTTATMMMNPDLERERSNCTFNVEKITHMLDGGKARTDRRRQLEAIIERDPTNVFSNNEANHRLHRTDRHVRGVAKGVRLIELCRMLGIGNECGGEITESVDFQTLVEAMADDTPLGEFELRQRFCGAIVVVFVIVVVVVVSDGLADSVTCVDPAIDLRRPNLLPHYRLLAFASTYLYTFW